LRSACRIAAAVAQEQPAEVALQGLPPAIQAVFAGADGKPDRSFCKLYEALQETEPAL
jgi:hypothetical protein